MRLAAGDGQQEDGAAGDAGGVGGLEGRLEQREAGEEGLGARGLELVLELGGRVLGVGRGDDAGEAVDGVGDGDVVDLGGGERSVSKMLGASHIVV